LVRPAFNASARTILRRPVRPALPQFVTVCSAPIYSSNLAALGFLASMR
jgi:hypothetical protein